MDPFDKAWNELSPTQSRAASWDQGPLLLLAGPGSGKTRVLTCRIARLLRQSPNESFRILAVTFTNKAADEMRTRIQLYASGVEARLFVGTFHGFCAEVLRQSGSAIGVPPAFKIYGEEKDREAVLEEALHSIAEELGAIRESDRRSLRLIDQMQQSLTFPESGENGGEVKSLEPRVVKIYRAYNDTLLLHNALDYNSLILKAYELFSRFPKLVERQRLVYRYICVDEFQDTNSSQYRLVRTLAPTPASNLFAVADDDQVIYQWNGADYRRIDQFSREYHPEALQLPLNYRCPPEIVAISNRLISHNFGRLRNKSPPEATRPLSSGEAVRLLPISADFEEEARAIADALVRLAHEGSTCVLARRHALLDVLFNAISEKGVDCVILQRKAEFESSPLVWLHSCLRLAADRQDFGSLRRLSGAFMSLTGADVDPEAVAAQASAKGRDLFAAWRDTVRALPVDSSFLPVLEAMERLGGQVQLAEFIRLARAWLTSSSAREESSDSSEGPTSNDLVSDEWAAWIALYREITGALGREPDLDTLLQELDMRSKETIPKPTSVHLMTIHGAKGREYDRVFLTGLVEDELPTYHSRIKGSESPEMEEERRACYVAVTRTKSQLTFSLAKEYFGRERAPSRFLTEMGLKPE